MKTTTYQKAPKMTPVPGVEITIIGNTDRVMLTYITAQPGAVIPSHAHPHDQVGTCVQGEGELVSGAGRHKTVPGTAWTIPGGEAHDWKNTGSSVAVLIETFCPPREDYLAKAK